MTTFTNQYQPFQVVNAPDDTTAIFKVSASTVSMTGVSIGGTINLVGTITTVSTAVTIASIPITLNGTTYYLLAAVTTGL